MNFLVNLSYTDAVSTRIYLVKTALAFLLITLSIGVFNWFSDPYGIWGPVDAERLNRNQQVFFLRLSKPYQISRIKPTAAIIGSSRSGPIDPQNKVWADENAYNLSMHGLTVHEMKRFVEHTIAQGRLKKLLIAIEFETFIQTGALAGLGPLEGRLSHPDVEGLSWQQLLQRAHDLRDTLLTSSTLALSIQSRLGRAPAGRAMQGDGSWRLHTRKMGTQGFEHVGKTILERLDKKHWGLHGNLELLAEILALCHRHGVDARLYLSPEHMLITDLRQQKGYGDEREEFLRQVISINEEVATASGGRPFPIWGFDHISGIVDHPLTYEKGDRQWFRDGIHFFSELGDIIMEQVWGGDGTAGYELDSDSLDAYFDEVYALRVRYLQHQKEQVLSYRKNLLGGE